jgi:hypothetical protein
LVKTLVPATLFAGHVRVWFVVTAAGNHFMVPEVDPLRSTSFVYSLLTTDIVM